jgi:hypothetical protein
VWESAEAMQVYEQSDFYRQEILPTLYPFFVGEFTTTYWSRSTLGPDNRMGSPGHYGVTPAGDAQAGKDTEVGNALGHGCNRGNGDLKDREYGL